MVKKISVRAGDAAPHSAYTGGSGGGADIGPS
ncbi:hypothetical protein BX285_6154 [Streptomyces sp. 1114.5]|nr:hypothetical protein BX285_6154 [Streptomyces sp. 1114.5]SOB79709.1 hypothetical protein SAMN06272789_0572 [Streptomyces sp. 1331.2]